MERCLHVASPLVVCVACTRTVLKIEQTPSRVDTFIYGTTFIRVQYVYGWRTLPERCLHSVYPW